MLALHMGLIVVNETAKDTGHVIISLTFSGKRRD